MLEALHPTKLLIIAPKQMEVLGGLSEWAAETLDPDTLLDAPTDPARFEAALVVDTLEHMSKARGGALIARLRDVYTQRLLVLTRLEETTREDPGRWTRHELMALGLRMIGPCTHRSRTWGLFHFDIFDYKTTPEWLNPRHWANPQMWDRRRW